MVTLGGLGLGVVGTRRAGMSEEDVHEIIVVEVVEAIT